MIYSRDKDGIEFLNTLLGNTCNGRVRFSPDVAFVLDPRRPDNKEIDSLEAIKTSDRLLVGLNVSGLLSLCDFDNNVFGLKANYAVLISKTIDFIMSYDNTVILMVAHSADLHQSIILQEERKKKGYHEQSDMVICRKFYNEYYLKYKDRIFLPVQKYDHGQTKYLIGLCDFFIGSRMHACIAALSQGIPAVGLAYSKKFYGVFESIGVKDMVIDMRQHGEDQVFEAVRDAYEKRENISEHLHRTIPEVQAKILKIFNDVEL